MQLYLVRHGIAEDRGDGGPDEARALTDEGMEKMREIGCALQALGCEPVRFLTSPLVRARETAQILAELLAPETELTICDGLAPGGAPPEVVRALGGERSDALLAGHLPGIAELAAYLLSGETDLDLVFRKGAVCCLSFADTPEAGLATLEWLLQPRHLRALAGG